MRFLAALTLAALLAGCASDSAPSLSDARTLDGGSPAWYVEHRARVQPEHRAEYDVPVAHGATLVNATLTLAADNGGLGVPMASAARLELRLVDPDGATLGSAMADLASPLANLRFEPKSAGMFTLLVLGSGFSHEVDGAEVGATYALVIDVT